MAVSAGPDIVEDGLVLSLDAGNYRSYPTSGVTWSNLSGKNITGTLTNGPTFSSTNQGSISFDGTNDYINLGTSIANNISPNISCSFNCWVKFNSIAKDQVIFATPNKTGGVPFLLWLDYVVAVTNNTGGSDIGGGNSVALVVLIGDPTPPTDLRYSTSNNIVAANTWYNICVVLDPPNDKFYTYLNGSLVALFNSATCSGIRTHSDNFIIGDTGTDAINGNIAQVSIYNKALSLQEVLQNFNALRGRFNL